jgi:hypothetical protein
MTAAGCAIQGSAIYRIDKGEPPRQVTVDELLALADVFDVENITDLLQPVELIEQKWAEAVAADFISATRELDDAQANAVRAVLRLAEVARTSADLYEFVAHQWHAASPARQWFGEFVGAEGVDNDALSRLTHISNQFWEQLLTLMDSATGVSAAEED